MSSMLKKRIRVDKNLASILGVKEGSLIGYAKMIKMIREYVRNQELIVEEQGALKKEEVKVEPIRLKYCFRCGSSIDPGANYCYRCGERLR
ncbi:MAG: zinc ribbon domain-containing protein [Candidatus Bathyarchaeia archaeon]